jgi:hypothetical protein
VLTGTFLFPARLAQGQAFVNGTITGTVTDSSGAVVPQAALTLTNTGTAAQVTSQSDTAGRYQFPNLAPGQYRLDVVKEGFTRFTREPIVVLVNADVRVDVTLQVGAVSQSVEVTAETPLLQTESSSLGQVIETRSVNELPLNGRNPLALVALTPGVVPQGQSGLSPVTLNPFAAGNIQINGGAANMSAAYWDGAPINTTGYVNLLALVPSQDALQEFKVQTDNLPAQYDRFAGGIINFSTKSGTNQVHGEAYEFIRNKVLNGNNFFSNATGVPVAPFTQNQFGGTFGGPLVIPHVYNGKDKTFFFASFDGFRLREGLPLLFSVPTEAMRNGDFSGLVDANGNQIPIYDPTTTCGVAGNPACATQGDYIRQQISYNGVLNVIPPNRIDPTDKILANLWGAPNTAGLQNGLINNWTGAASEGGDMNEFTIRADQNVSDKQRMFARYTINKYDNLPIDPFGTHAYPLEIGTPENTKTQQFVFDESYSFASTKVLDVELSYLRNHYTRTPQSLGFDLGTLGAAWAPLNNEVTFRTLPDISMLGLTDFSSGETGSTIRDETDDWGLLPNFTIIKGRNTIKIGGDFRLSRFNYCQTNNPSGSFSFDTGFTELGPTQPIGGFSFASFMFGAVSSGGVWSQNFAATQIIYRAAYVMDDVRATRKLSLNLGLRYSQEGPFSERFNRISTFLPNVPNPLIGNTSLPHDGMIALVDTPLRRSRNGTDMDDNMWGPRIGFAYQLTPNSVIRGGYGLFWLPNTVGFLSGENPAWDEVNGFTTAMTSTINGGLTPYNYMSNPYPNGIIPPPGRNPVYALDLLGQGESVEFPSQPYANVQQWNFDIQQTLKGGVFVDAAYAGSKGTHLPAGMDIGQLPNQDESMGNSLLNFVTNPYYGIVTTGGLSGPTVQEGQLLTPYPQYTGLYPAQYQGNSNYNAFQLKVQKRFNSGQTILVSYTNSKYFTDSEAVTSWLEAAGSGGFANNYDLHAERALSAYDISQRLVASYVLDLPVGYGKKFLSGATGPVNKLVSGWGMEGVTTVQTGFPIYIYNAVNTSFSWGGGQRPNYNSSAPGCAHSPALSGSAVSRLDEWFNTGCWSQPANFTFGNVPRTEPNIRWGGMSDFDWAVVKNTSFGPEDKMRLQFRAEFFNLFNHPQFGPPGNCFGCSGFGVVSSQYNNPRLVQFALKFAF